MKINFYNTKVTEEGRTFLVKENTVYYSVDRMNTEEKVVEMMNQLLAMGSLAEEHFYMIALNMSCQIIGIFLLTKGTVRLSLVGIREIYLRALLCGATSILLVHNHPSKNVSPSREDLNATIKVQEAGTLINIELLDHIIIGGNNFYSFRKENLI